MSTTVDDHILSDLHSMDIHYIIGDIIARGQFSTVYTCLYKGKIERACRIYPKANVDYNKLRQLKHIKEIRHPNIISLFEGFESDSEVRLISERVKGEELFERIVSLGHYSEVQAATVIFSILSALESLHSRNIVHGDIRPESLLYQTEDLNSTLKLRDVSFSRLPPRTVYVEPEHEGVCTMAGDIWSLGIVLYTMLSGYEPEINCKELVEVYPGLFLPTCDMISNSAVDFLKEMLNPKSKQRITARDALKNSWVKGKTTHEIHLTDTIKRLKEFNARQKFRAATKAVLATQKLTLSTIKRKQCR